VSGARHSLARWRDGLRHRPAANLTYRIVVGVVGLVVLVVGIIAIPYPGPGWAIVFLGLAILASEFAWAQRLLHQVKGRYDRVMAWLKEQGLWAQVLGAVLTCAVVVASVWLLGALAWMGNLIGLDWPWLRSPLGLGPA
jgi:uncharacterized protein (TIGR02611 family)